MVWKNRRCHAKAQRRKEDKENQEEQIDRLTLSRSPINPILCFLCFLCVFASLRDIFLLLIPGTRPLFQSRDLAQSPLVPLFAGELCQ
jgi:hypothetical protein